MYKEYTVKVFDSGNVHWYNSDGELHREDGPACEYADGKVWFLNGEIHREDGPAVEDADGYKEWYLNGEELTEEEFNKRLATCDGKVVEVEGRKYELKLVK